MLTMGAGTQVKHELSAQHTNQGQRKAASPSRKSTSLERAVLKILVAAEAIEGPERALSAAALSAAAAVAAAASALSAAAAAEAAAAAAEIVAEAAAVALQEVVATAAVIETEVERRAQEGSGPRKKEEAGERRNTTTICDGHGCAQMNAVSARHQLALYSFEDNTTNIAPQSSIRGRWGSSVLCA